MEHLNSGLRARELPSFLENQLSQNKVMRNGRAMVVQTKLFFLLQVCVLIFIVNLMESVERSKHGCIICGEKSQRTPFRSLDSVQSNADLEACFGFVEKKSEDICEACRKAL